MIENDLTFRYSDQIAVLNIMVPDEVALERSSPQPTDSLPRRTAEQELIWRQRLSDPR